MNDKTPRIYPVYLCRSRTFERSDGTVGTEVYQQDVVAFAPTREQAEAYASKLNEQHGCSWTDDDETRRVYFTFGHGRVGIVSLPRAITLVG